MYLLHRVRYVLRVCRVLYGVCRTHNIKQHKHYKNSTPNARTGARAHIHQRLNAYMQHVLDKYPIHHTDIAHKHTYTYV